MWRRMRVDYKGGGVAVRLAGVGALNTFPKCDYVSNLGSHLDAWEDLYDEFGTELADAPDQLYVIFKRILPTSIITELLDRIEVTDYQTALAYCRRRTDFKKEQELQAHAQKKMLGNKNTYACYED